MDALDSLRTQFLVSAVFGLPLASLVLHLVLKPKFWTPSFIILAIAIPAFGVVEYLPAGEHRPIKPFVYAATSAVFFAVLFFFLSVLIGLIVRLFFRQEYAAKEERDMRTPRWRRRSRVLAAIALMLGVGSLVFGWTVRQYHFELKGTLLAAICFYLAYKYWCSAAGAGSISDWLFKGEIGRKRAEPSNSTAESDARKNGARGSP